MDGLIKQEKNELIVEEIDTGSDELSQKKNEDDDLAESNNKMELAVREDGEKKVTITYRKKSK